MPNKARITKAECGVFRCDCSLVVADVQWTGKTQFLLLSFCLALCLLCDFYIALDFDSKKKESLQGTLQTSQRSAEADQRCKRCTTDQEGVALQTYPSSSSEIRIPPLCTVVSGSVGWQSK